MNKPMISVRNLSKIYALGERQPYYSFRDTLSGLLHLPFRKEKMQKDEFLALRDVSFDVNKGDVVGVIGRNGAGKSTLLKILSRITPPTSGEIILQGRVASLLEVGTGFHPELTGRENIYLNGVILGMKSWEINNKFNEIVEFAETEKFLDTPVKHYSSGMYMRLAFAVAAHLEPEILLVDEVLAVGDAQFQKKCLGKMSEISKNGRTVIFVSHNMGSVSNLCSRCVLLDQGSVIKIGVTSDVIQQYLNPSQSNIDKKNIAKNKEMYISDIYTKKGNSITKTFSNTDDISLIVKIIRQNIVSDSVIGLVIKDKFQRKLFTEVYQLNHIGKVFGDKLLLELKIPKNFLVPNSYSVDAAIHVPNKRIIDYIQDIPLFEVVDVGSKFYLNEGLDYGMVFTSFNWKVSKVD